MNNYADKCGGQKVDQKNRDGFWESECDVSFFGRAAATSVRVWTLVKEVLLSPRFTTDRGLFGCYRLNSFWAVCLSLSLSLSLFQRVLAFITSHLTFQLCAPGITDPVTS